MSHTRIVSFDRGYVTTSAPVEVVLQSLQRRMTDLQNPIIRDRALSKFGPQTRRRAESLTRPGRRFDERLVKSLPNVGDEAASYALRRAHAFIILCRYEEYFEQEKHKLGQTRSFINGAGDDPLQRLVECWQDADDEALIRAVVNEAQHHLAPNVAMERLMRAAAFCLEKFQLLAREAILAPGCIEPYDCPYCHQVLIDDGQCPMCNYSPENCDATIEWDIGGQG